MKILYIVLMVFFSIGVNSQSIKEKENGNVPEQEFVSGHVQTYSTKGHPKANGSDWSIKVPTSWRSQEATASSIIQKFISKDGEGIESIMLSVSNLPLGSSLSKKDIDDLFTESEAKDMIPDNVKFLSFEKMTFNGISGGVIYYENMTSHKGIDVTANTTQYMFIYKRQLYMIICSVPVGKGAIYSDPKKFSNLFKLVANSVIVNQRK